MVRLSAADEDGADPVVAVERAIERSAQLLEQLAALRAQTGRQGIDPLLWTQGMLARACWLNSVGVR